ncbi:hypothetical protein [Iodobacter fluviatilis]|uniref:Uncharacterized protein n=1 Tax=Iodobacter fluviatilis TaxID=537 RepID=A0A377Q8D5_9NEIS|nr:hypothetical protein [Iodobacter fluviatilis]TCU88786.1 hypothetical protein EV682_103370 [Iodobacter fluviatilis]STQ91142.1 Uncharacterised protein [Iodobacter fluviatilis]
MRKHFYSALLGLSLIHPFALADINDILGLQQAINAFCGTKMNVILVDESHSNPPCILSYSDGCEETQPDSPQSCQVVLRDQEDKAAEGKVVSVSW